MVKTTLVGPDLAVGKDILRTLDAVDFPVSVALWLLRKERSDDWELVLGTPLRDKLGAHEAYLRLIKAISKEASVALSDVPIRLESNRRPFIRALRKTFGKAASVEGMRLGLQSIGGTWVDDAYLYRIK
jgi:hypothetical protein